MWSDEKRRELGAKQRARLAALPPERRRALTERARAGTVRAAAWRRQLRAAELLRQEGWTVLPPSAEKGEDDRTP